MFPVEKNLAFWHGIIDVLSDYLANYGRSLLLTGEVRARTGLRGRPSEQLLRSLDGQ